MNRRTLLGNKQIFSKQDQINDDLVESSNQEKITALKEC